MTKTSSSPVIKPATTTAKASYLRNSSYTTSTSAKRNRKLLFYLTWTLRKILFLYSECRRWKQCWHEWIIQYVRWVAFNGFLFYKFTYHVLVQIFYHVQWQLKQNHHHHNRINVYRNNFLPDDRIKKFTLGISSNELGPICPMGAPCYRQNPVHHACLRMTIIMLYKVENKNK
jgi:hypothetical protein